LLVPSEMVGLAVARLIDEGCLPQPWHLEGRHGIRTRPLGGRTAIPLLTAAARQAEGYVASVARGDTDTGQLPPALRALLEHDDVDMEYLPVQPPITRQEPHRDNTAHSELACETVWMPSPARGSFTFVELFAGIGGFRLGLEALGGRCVFGSEIAAECVTVYEANFGSEPPVAGDIYQVKDEDIPQHDVLLGGFPCQPFSWLGSQPGISDERGVLYKEIVRVLRAHRPSAFLLENVPGLLTCDGGRVITRIVSELESLGYSVSLEKVDSRCLTAQSRYRVFIVGIRQDGGVEGQAKKFRFPYIPDLALRVGDVLESDADLIAAGAVELHTLRQEQVLRWGSKEGLRNLAWHDTITHTLVSHYGGQLGRGSSQLVPRPPPHLPRRFTPRECARLMGFPESFDLGAPKPGDAPNEVNAWCRSRYSMLGNAVSPPLIAVLAGAILAQCPDVASERDWDATGRSVAIQLALQALPAQCREKILGRVHASFRQVVAE